MSDSLWQKKVTGKKNPNKQTQNPIATKDKISLFHTSLTPRIEGVAGSYQSWQVNKRFLELIIRVAGVFQEVST